MIGTATTSGFQGSRAAFVALLLAVAPFRAAFPAEEPERYLVEYREFRAALEAGDTELATVHGHLAWRAAEESLGDHRLTAILAYNYARLLAGGDPAGAVAVFARAVELQEAGVGELDEQELDVQAAYAEFRADESTWRKARRLREALEAREAEGGSPFGEHAEMWLALAAAAIRDQRYRTAGESAARAESLLRSTAPERSRGLAQALLLGGAAKLAPLSRRIDDVQDAHNAFVRARRLFEPQADLEDFDPLLGQIVAWDGAAGAALKALDREDYPDHEGADGDTVDAMPDLFAAGAYSSEQCDELEWREREPPRYPSGALRRGTIGAVIVGFNLNDDLEITDATILAEVPQKAFGESALESMADWRLAASPVDDPACRRNLLTKFTFVIDD